MVKNSSTLRQLLDSKGGLHLSVYLKNDGTALSQLQDHFLAARTTLTKNPSELPISDLFQQTSTAVIGALESLEGLPTVAIFVKEGFCHVQELPTVCDSFYVVANSFHVKPIMNWLQDVPTGTLIYCERNKIKFISVSSTEIRTIFDLPFNTDLFGDRQATDCCEGTGLQPLGLFLWLKLMFENKGRSLPSPLIVYGDGEVLDRVIAAFERIPKRKITCVKNQSEPNLGEALQWALKSLHKESKKERLRLKTRYSQSKSFEKVSDDWNEILKALVEGRLLSLMVASDVRVFGKIDKMNCQFRLSLIQKDHEDDDVLDDLSQMAMKKGIPTLFYDSSKLPPSQRKLLRGLIETKTPRTPQPHFSSDQPA